MIRGEHYIEVGEVNSISNIIQFTFDVGGLDMSEVEGFEGYVETLEIIVRR